MKKIVCLCMTCLFAFFLSVPVMAKEETPKKSNVILENGIENSQPRVATVCGNLSYHKMISSGIGHVYYEDGSRYIYYGAAWQCENCNLVMVTEGDYLLGEMTTIGKWATMGYDYKINSYGVTIIGASSYGTCNSNTMNGYKFYLVP